MIYQPSPFAYANLHARLRKKGRAVLKCDWLAGLLVLAVILNIAFFPAIWNDKTLLDSAWNAPSILPSGAYGTDPLAAHSSPTPDPGAPAWQSEPWLKVISEQYLHEHLLPLWNPYEAYGTPFAAAMLPQPYYPLTALVSLHPTAWTYNFLVIGRLFLAGAFTFLFARLFIGYAGSLFAGITFMLTGYFIIFMDMPHLSVEVLPPLLLLAIELLLRKNTPSAILALAAVVYLCLVGGMPESSFLVLVFGALYFLFRLITVTEFRAIWGVYVWKFGYSMIFGFGLAAFLLVPFLELVLNGHDTHQFANLHGEVPGLIADSNVGRTIAYLIPLIFGPIDNSIFGGGWTGVIAYWGLLPAIFSVLAVLDIWRKGASSLRCLTIFFLISIVLMLLKRFGSPLVNWIGALPIANMVIYPKYQEPLLAFCVAILAGIGFSNFVSGRSKKVNLLGAGLLVLVLLLGLALLSLPLVRTYPDSALIFYRTLLAGVVLIGGVLFLFSISPRYPRSAWLRWSLIAMLSAELLFTFIYPTFYCHTTLPSAEAVSPYKGAPYIDFLRNRVSEFQRVVARDGFLYPDWSGAFQLMDVRDLQAMYYRRYITFIRSFLLRPGDHARVTGELADRFTGLGDEYSYDFSTELEKRFLRLSSVKYLISGRQLSFESDVSRQVVDQHRAETLWGFGLGEFPVGNGKTSSGVLQHAPSHRISFKTLVSRAKPIFKGVASISSPAQDKSDGVGFRLEIMVEGRVEPLFSTFLNPKDLVGDRSGREFHIDLSDYVGKQIELLFSTDSGPTSDNTYDWAGWADLHFAPKNGREAGISPFKEIYNKDVHIYELSGTLPRAALFSSAEIVPDLQVLARLKDPAFNPNERVILSAESLPKNEIEAFRAFMGAKPSNSGVARIAAYDSQFVGIETNSPAPAILMLNDTNYPGWRVFVNGKEAFMVQANYLFRGVLVPAGHATVEFRYQPSSFRSGIAISAISLIALVVPFFLRLGKTGVRERPPEVALYKLGAPRSEPPRERLGDRPHGENLEWSAIMNSLDRFDIVIHHKNEKVIARIPKLGLFAKGETGQEALAALDQKKAALAAELADIEDLDQFQAVAVPAAVGGLGQFVIKTGIVAIAFAAVLVMSGFFVAASLQEVVANIKNTKIGGVQFWTRVEQELDRMASPTNDLPDQKKQKILGDVRAIAAKWRPFVMEIHSAIVTPENPSPPSDERRK
jgi:hypothetical protein